MRLSSKHSNQQTITMYDFTGGLNSSVSPENIGQNQLFRVTNMEPDGASGLLKTVAGTRQILSTPFKVFSATFDRINQKFIIISDETAGKKIYAVPASTAARADVEYTALADLSGTLKPIYALWENGILIASGGKLQYFDGENVQTITTSPDKCSGVYVRNGRVLVANTDKNTINFSGIGDEASWEENSGDPSTSKWLETGYKDGGKFIGMASLSDNIIIFKDNGYAYRLTGNYPDWNLQEISRQIDCGGRLSFCSLTNTVLVLGQYNIQLIDTTQDYSDIKAGSISTQVSSQLQQMASDAEMIFLPPLNQVWVIGSDGFVLMYSTTFKAFFTRQFNSRVVTAFSYETAVFIAKEDGIYILDDTLFQDGSMNGSPIPLAWSFTSRRMVSGHEYLLKRVQVNVSPSFLDAGKDYISIGRIKIPVPITIQQYANDSELIYDNDTLIYNNTTKIYPEIAVMAQQKCVYRSKALTVKGNGTHGRLLINSIIFDVAEV